ncbi:ribose 5-phosphate isomerase B [Nanoarchaeota archaeon]
MNIIIGSDHAGFSTKEKLKRFLQKKNIPFEDMGTDSTKSIDYPDIAKKVAGKVAKSRTGKGLLVCGSGTGMAIAANKVKGVRAVAAYDTYTARMSRQDNDTNVLCLRGRRFPLDKIEKIIDIWLKTPFSNSPRHKQRIAKIKRLERT